VVDPFDPPARDWLPGHRGVDLAAVRGSVVHAAGDGVVIWAGPVAGRGVLVVLHADGRRTTYEPVDPLVAVGGEVLAGDAIGVVVRGTGHCGGSYPCLHWGLVRGDTYLDPMRLLDPREPVLLPLGAGP
jgi:murein DD-endopeptidase MepM/ murein hydrolase activator NlpD